MKAELSFRFPERIDSATAPFVLIVGGLMLAIGVELGASMHHLLTMIG